MTERNRKHAQELICWLAFWAVVIGGWRML